MQSFSFIYIDGQPITIKSRPSAKPNVSKYLPVNSPLTPIQFDFSSTAVTNFFTASSCGLGCENPVHRIPLTQRQLHNMESLTF